MFLSLQNHTFLDMYMANSNRWPCHVGHTGFDVHVIMKVVNIFADKTFQRYWVYWQLRYLDLNHLNHSILFLHFLCRKCLWNWPLAQIKVLAKLFADPFSQCCQCHQNYFTCRIFCFILRKYFVLIQNIFIAAKFLSCFESFQNVISTIR